MAQSMTTAGGSLAARILRYWLPVFAMIGAMYFLSTDVFSGESTRGMLDVIVRWFRPGISETRIASLNYIVRKAAHFCEYAVLAMLIYRAFRADSRLYWRFTWALYTLLMVVAWASVDELHQSMTHLRGGSVYDSALDASGGLFAIVIIALYSIRRQIPRIPR
jgi:VanZ family protein